MKPVLTVATTVAALLCLSAVASAAPAATPVAASQVDAAAAAAGACPAFLNHEFRKLRSSGNVNVCRDFAGKPLLIVNTASHCGYTPQFKGLQALHEKYKDKGLIVIGFPSDDFQQEAKDEAETAEVCFLNYGVTFTMLSPTAVTGRNANPVFAELARQQRQPGWNFNKYLVTPQGRVTAYFDSNASPDSAQLNQAIGALLR
jgi:glutathione peroxidase